MDSERMPDVVMDERERAARKTLKRMPPEMATAKVINGLLDMLRERDEQMEGLLARDRYVARNLPYMTKEQVAHWLGREYDSHAEDTHFPERYALLLEYAVKVAHPNENWVTYKDDRAVYFVGIQAEDAERFARDVLEKVGWRLMA